MKAVLSLPSWECGLKCLLPMSLATISESLPSWECGLKSERACATEIPWSVAPFVGVWIEILIQHCDCIFLYRRSLRGSVD